MKFSKRMFLMLLTVMLLGSVLSVPAFAAESDCIQGIAFVNASSLRLRGEASTNSKILGSAAKNEVVVLLGREGDWYKVNYNLTVGYMHKDYLKTATKENAELGYGKVTASAVNLRQKPTTASASLGTVSGGSKCYIIGVNEGWYKVISGSRIGYIRSDYLELTEAPYENAASSNSPKFFRLGKSTGVTPSAAALKGTSSSASGASGANISGAAIVAEAQKYLGAPYVAGGASPSGFDCSGFVSYVVNNCGAGFSFGRLTAESWRQQCSIISASQMRPGDLIFFQGTYNTSGASHVGIYLGDGKMIHCGNPVKISSINTAYWQQHFYCYGRIPGM